MCILVVTSAAITEKTVVCLPRIDGYYGIVIGLHVINEEIEICAVYIRYSHNFPAIIHGVVVGIFVIVDTKCPLRAII